VTRFFSGALVVLAALYLGFGAEQAPTNAHTPAPVRSAPTSGVVVATADPTLEHEVDALTQRVAGLDARHAELAGEVDLLAADVSPDAAPSRSLDDVLAEQVRETQATVARMDRAWTAEQEDPAWSEAATRSVDEAVTSALVGGLGHHEVSCRSSLCLLRLDFENLGARESVMSALPTRMPWSAEGFFHADDDTPQHVEVYFAREGASLPRS